MKCSLGISNFLEEISAAAAAKSLQSCLTLSDPMDCSFPGSSVHGIFQTRILEWGASLSQSVVFLYFFALIVRKAFLSLLAILWNSAFKCLYLSFSPLFFASLLFTLFVRPPQTSILLFVHFFSMGMVLIPVSCTMS